MPNINKLEEWKKMLKNTSATVQRENWPSRYGNPEWFIHDRFGLFIHWGLYSNAARHEWVMNREKIHPDTYNKYFKFFNPDLYDPKKWARIAKSAGMKYFVITTKHHEGFALWDSKLTNYKVTNTPIQRDLLLEMVNAFREEGLKVGFYHSLIDWHHPEFPIDGLHPQRDDDEFNVMMMNLKKKLKIVKWQIMLSICMVRVRCARAFNKLWEN
ncbi:hypothetical protein ACA29_12920 [Lederbergia galactosidilytica]|uniref:alpha-L-fucosidase n=1 Tax=Lederbergia galactosidilytica TaxID=217031 RepID=A0A0Q9XTT7_9BACI|nr:hypothetical protein ACA29_12920 [Lederbergia galactosidilytica]